MLFSSFNLVSHCTTLIYYCRFACHIRRVQVEKCADWIDSLKTHTVAELLHSGTYSISWATDLMVFEESDFDVSSLGDTKSKDGFVLPQLIIQDDCILVLHASFFHHKATLINDAITQWCWNQDLGLFFDYNTDTQQQDTYETVTSSYALWAQCCTDEQADKMIPVFLEKFEVGGGLVSGTEASRGQTSLQRPNRQWDFPYGYLFIFFLIFFFFFLQLGATSNDDMGRTNALPQTHPSHATVCVQVAIHHY